MMDKRTLATCLPIGVVIALPVLTAWGNPWLLGSALVSLLILAVWNGRCRRFLFAVTMTMLIWAAIAAAMARLWIRESGTGTGVTN